MQLSFHTSDIIKQHKKHCRTAGVPFVPRFINGSNVKCLPTSHESNAPVNHGLHQSPAQPIRKSVVTRFQTSKAEETFHSVVPVQRSVVLVTESSSKVSDAAVDWAINNALRPGDKLHMVQLTKSTQADAAVAEGMAGKFGAALNSLQVGLHTHTVPVRGKDNAGISKALAQQVKTWDASTVILATEEHHGLGELLQGQLPDLLAKDCSSPIAVIHMPRQPMRREVTEEAQVSPLPHRQLVLAVDDSQDSIEAAKWTLDNLYNTGDVIHLVHVVPCIPFAFPVTGSDLLMYPGIQTERAVFEKEQELAEKEALEWRQDKARRFADIMNQHGAEYTFDILVHQTEDPVLAISLSIASQAEELEAAAVILVHHHRGLLEHLIMGSVTDEVAHHCARPVLLLETHSAQ